MLPYLIHLALAEQMLAWSYEKLRTNKPRILFVYAFSVPLLLLFFYQSFCITRFLFNPLASNLKAPVIFQVLPGKHLHAIATDLQRAGLLTHPTYFIILAKCKRIESQLQVGEYLIDNKLRPDQLLSKLFKGEVLQYKLTLIEGDTFDALWRTIQNQKKINSARLNKNELMARLGQPNLSPEGMFLAETYYYTAQENNAFSLLKKAHQQLQKILMQGWMHRENGLPYHNAYEALIVASLIEKETAEPNEYPLISAVIKNRLQKNMRLQFDPTIIYALNKDYHGHLGRSMLKINSPYNTYRHYGLPPTPIALPSKAVIQAALHPANVDYLYFVAKAGGGHEFSSDLLTHNKAVKRYRHQTHILRHVGSELPMTHDKIAP